MLRKILNLEGVHRLGKKERKKISGGVDGFDCGPVFDRCDNAYPNDYYAFQRCMHWAACIYQ
jgi:hypothetical protein